MQSENTQVAVKDGAQERFWKKFQEIQKREELRVLKEKEYELKAAQTNARDKYRDAARSLAARWLCFTCDDFRQVEQEHGELEVLDKLLLRKVRKNLLVLGSAAAVLGSTLYIADVAAATWLISIITPGPSLIGWCGLLGLLALAVGNIVLAVKPVEYLKNNLSKELTFLYHRKTALLKHQEPEKEIENAK